MSEHISREAEVEETKAMAVSQELQPAANAMSRVQQQVEMCHQTALALIETNQPWVSTQPSKRWNALPLTDYERARAAVLDEVDAARTELSKVRSSAISPEAIRATGLLAAIRTACSRCVEVNQLNIAPDKPYVCHAQLQCSKSPDPFEFSGDNAKT